ncbi:TPA: helix-turn-helix domain-containing protein [Legionella pneumophila]|nr:helix-turn-helix domain-containing protein [Legionella pneumophila]HAT8332578.1 helix-turn-helix domain-containing protein [Legionella pneumophila]
MEARKAKGLTRKALADLTDDLKQSRINNWERGMRTPGPGEVKQLAHALEVPAAFLMCLSDEKINQTKNPSRLVPLLNHYQACEASSHIKAIREMEQQDEVIFISVSTELLPNLGYEAFALKMLNDSMHPEIRINDIQVIDPSIVPKPGDFVVVKINSKPEVIICKYKKLSYTSADFELLTLNDNWPSIRVCDDIKAEIIGVVVQNIRGY